MNIDKNATSFLNQAITVAGKTPVIHFQYNLDDLGDMYVPWDGEKVEELARGKRISTHEWENKVKKFSFFKKAASREGYYEATIIAIRSGKDSPTLIIDGVGRAVGIRKVILENPARKNGINLIVFLIESQEVVNLPDYKRLLEILEKQKTSK